MCLIWPSDVSFVFVFVLILNECSTCNNQRISCKNTDPWPWKKSAQPGPPGAFLVEQDVLRGAGLSPDTAPVLVTKRHVG